MDIRELVATRLAGEFARRNISAADVAAACNIDESKISTYISGPVDINIHELKCICDSINFNFFLLISPSYSPSPVHYRNISTEAKSLAIKIENSFQIIKDFFPASPAPNIAAPEIISNRRNDLIATIPSLIQRVNAAYNNSTIEWMYDLLNIVVIPINSNFQFDAFFLSSDDKCAVCVKRNQPPCRIRFSLLHEFYHYLFDRNSSIDVDIDLFQGAAFYTDVINDNCVNEFLATKFAQYFLIPFDNASRWSTSWPNDTYYEEIQSTVLSNKTSREVLVNALYDLLRIRNERSSYADISNSFNWVRSSADNSINEFLERKINVVRDRITENRDKLSDDVFNNILGDLSLG